MKRTILIFIIYSLLLAMLISIKLYVDKQNNDQLKKVVVNEEAQSLSALTMSLRKTYQDAFKDNHIEINDKTINLLPVRTSADIANRFSKLLNNRTTIRTVSDRPRNPQNLANKNEMKIIKFFNKNPKEESFIEVIDSTTYYAIPLRIEKSCLRCHGDIGSADSIIRVNYKDAYNYKLGDLRGILSINMTKRKVVNLIDSKYDSTVLLALIMFLVIVTVGFITVKIILRNEKDFTDRLKRKVAEKTEALREENSRSRALNEQLNASITELTQSKESIGRQKRIIEDSEKRFAKLIDTFKNGLYIINQDFRITYMNKPFKEKLGRDAVGESCYKAIHNNDEKCSWCVYDELKLKGVINYNIEKEGKQLRTRNVLMDDNSKLTIIYDETKRIEMEQALKESEAKFRAITNSANDAIVLIDNNEKIALWNHAAQDIFGYTENEILGKNLHDILPPMKYRDRAHNAFALFRKSGKGNAINKTLELEGLKKDGTIISIELSLSAIEVDHKWNSVGVVRDITLRKEFERELRKSKEKVDEVVRQFEETIENLEDVYFKTDKSFVYQQVSPSALKHLNLDGLEQIVGEPLTKFWNISKEERNSVILTIRKDKLIKDYLIEYKSLSGERKFGRVNARSIVKNGVFSGIEGIIRDVTKQVEHEEVLKELNERLNKNYLDSVKQNLEIAAKNKEIEKQVEIIADKNRQFENAVDNLEDVYFKADRRLIYTYVSPSILSHLDLSSFNQVIGKPLMEFWDITENDSKKLVLKMLRNGSVSNLPIKYITIKGRKRYATVNASSIFVDGVFVGVEGIIRDITDNYLNNKKIQNLNVQKKILIDNIPAYIFYKDLDLCYIEVNSSFAQLIGISVEELIGKTDRDVIPFDLATEYESMDREVIESKNPVYNSVKYQKDRNGNNQWISTTKIPLMSSDNEVIGVIGVVRDITSQMEYEESLLESKERIEQAHKKMLDNINYAKTIQQALLTSEETLKQCLSDSFVLYKPKDRVSGDFYYIKKIGDHLVFAAADCTGHGVSGAFLTMLGITYLHDISNVKQIDNPGKALDALRDKVKTTFESFGSENHNGLDIALCAINLETYELEYAGAYNPLYLVRDGELIEYKATRNPIGYYPKEVNFENHIIQLQKDDTLYLFSDGYIDQMGGSKKKKLKAKRFKEIILEANSYPISQQKDLLSRKLEEWSGNEEQTDDIVVMGLRI